jgi:hypothetical protein
MRGALHGQRDLLNIIRTKDMEKKQNFKGLEGTLQVLKSRRELEEEIFNGLSIT